MTPVNVTMSLQYGGRQQSKWLHFKKKINIQKWKVCKKKKKKKKKESVMGVKVDRKTIPSWSQSGITRQASWCQTVTFGTDFFYQFLTPMIDSYFLEGNISCVLNSLCINLYLTYIILFWPFKMTSVSLRYVISTLGRQRDSILDKENISFYCMHHENTPILYWPP